MSGAGPQPPYGPPPYGQQPHGQPLPYGYPPYGYPPYGYPPSAPQLPPYPHAQPEPYHRILRTWTYRPWRVLVGLLLAIVLGIVAGPLIVTALVAVGVEVLGIGSAGGLLEDLDLTSGVTPQTLLVVNLSLAMLIPITWLIVRYLHNLRPRWLGSVRPGLRWGWLATCFGLALLATIVATSLASLLLPGEVTPPDSGGSTQSTATTVAFLVIIALTSPLQSAGEEYFFRGYLLQGFGALVRAPWFTLTWTSLLFAIAHGSQNLPLFVDRFAFGLVAGGLVLFTGGLEAGIAMHIVNNVVVLGLAAATGALPQTLGTTAASWSLVAFDLGQFALFAVAVVLLARHRQTAARTPGPPPKASAASPASTA
ncbi:MAG TPA: CPBP family glutamic-type intramembrane protease [Nocardioidaceae bacterium]|nr:CPBP family glutamic-type intramembrane protease [Nocardioidaceae bacterium]